MLSELPGLTAPRGAVVSKPRAKPEATAPKRALAWQWETATTPVAVYTPAAKHLYSTYTVLFARALRTRLE